MDDDKDNQTQKPDDNDTPPSTPDDVSDITNPTHPQTDSNVDEDEVYHEGLGVIAPIDPADAEEVELEGDSH